MQIETKEFEFTKGEFFAIQVVILLKKRWLVFVGFFAFAAYFLFLYKFQPATIVIAVVLISYPFLLIVYLWRFACASENKIIYIKRRYEFSDEFIKGFLNDGSNSATKYDRITKAFKTNKHFIMNISRSQSFIIPLRAFQSQDDINAFDTFLRQKNLL